MVNVMDINIYDMENNEYNINWMKTKGNDMINLYIERKDQETDSDLPQITRFNDIYEEKGFNGVLDEVSDKLECGSVVEKGNGIVCISTGGWSDDETILYSLTHFLSMFGYNHYVGKLRGGAFYFSRTKHVDDFEITKVEI